MVNLLCTESYPIEHFVYSPNLSEVTEQLQQLLQREQRTAFPLPHYITTIQQDGMTLQWRSKLCTWVLQVTTEFQFDLTTGLLCMQLIDRYLSLQSISQTQMRLIPLVCMLIASKYNETCPMQMNEAMQIAQSSVSMEQIYALELRILQALDWKLTVSNPLELGRLFWVYLQEQCVGLRFNTEIVSMLSSLLQQVVTEYSFLAFRPSIVACSTLHMVLQLQYPKVVWYRGWQSLRREFLLNTEALNACTQLLLKHATIDSHPIDLLKQRFRSTSPTSIDEYPAKRRKPCSP